MSDNSNFAPKSKGALEFAHANDVSGVFFQSQGTQDEIVPPGVDKPEATGKTVIDHGAINLGLSINGAKFQFVQLGNESDVSPGNIPEVFLFSLHQEPVKNNLFHLLFAFSDEADPDHKIQWFLERSIVLTRDTESGSNIRFMKSCMNPEFPKPVGGKGVGKLMEKVMDILNPVVIDPRLQRFLNHLGQKQMELVRMVGKSQSNMFSRMNHT